MLVCERFTSISCILVGEDNKRPVITTRLALQLSLARLPGHERFRFRFSGSCPSMVGGRRRPAPIVASNSHDSEMSITVTAVRYP